MQTTLEVHTTGLDDAIIAREDHLTGGGTCWIAYSEDYPGVIAQEDTCEAALERGRELLKAFKRWLERKGLPLEPAHRGTWTTAGEPLDEPIREGTPDAD